MKYLPDSPWLLMALGAFLAYVVLPRLFMFVSARKQASS